jgi:type II secretion system protein E
MSKGNIFDDVDISDILNDTSIIDGIEKDIFGDNTDSGEENLDTYNGNNEESDDNENEDSNITSIDSVEGLSEDQLSNILGNIEEEYINDTKNDDINSFSLDRMVNESAEDTIRNAMSEKTIDKSRIQELTMEELMKIDKNSELFPFLSTDQKDIVLAEEDKRFTMDSFGSEILGYMNKKGVIEISLEQDGFIWVEEFGQPERINTGIKLNPIDSTRIIQLVSKFNGHTITREHPKIDGVTPNGMRFSALMYDCVQYKNVFSIRKPSGIVIPLEQYVDRKIMTKEQVDFIAKQIIDKKNIIFSGGTSSGKTTSINSFMTVLKNIGDKIISIEDTPELMLSSKIWTRLISNRYIRPIELLQQCMRLSPDRMMIGEIRTGEVTLEFLKAMNSGHNGGITSIHANDLYSTILKLEQYLSEVLTGEYWRLITTAVDMIINVGINPVTHERPMVKGIGVLKGYNQKTGEYILEDAMTGKRIENPLIIS